MVDRADSLDSLAKSVTFRDRRQSLSGYLYGMLRSLELAAAWVPLTADITIKFRLAECVGVLGRELKSIADRLAELLMEAPQAVANPKYEGAYGAAAKIPSVAERLDFLASVLRGLCVDMRRFEDSTNGVGDAPTIAVLGNTRRALEHQVMVLSGGASVPCTPFLGPADGECRTYSGDEAIPELVDVPARPPHWSFADTTVFTHRSNADLLDRGEHLRRWLHEIGINVEIDATELCCRNIVEFRDMPLEFRVDMARQAWDESRHAMLLRSHLRALGGDFGDYTYNAKVWRRYMTGASLGEKLAIEQVFQEGNALEGNVPFCEILKDAGAHDLAESLDYIDADEFQHARIGNKWLQFICQAESISYVDVVRTAAAKIGMPLASRAPILKRLREAAGYPAEFIDVLSAPPWTR